MGGALPIVLSLAGAAVQHVTQRNSQQQAAKEERARIDATSREVASALSRQRDFNRKASDVVARTLPKLEPARRAEQQQAIEERLVGEYSQALAPSAEAGLPEATQGQLSTDYLSLKAERAGEVAGKAAQLAKLLGKVSAPQFLGAQESYEQADLATQLGLIRNQAAGTARADDVAIQAAQGQPIAPATPSTLGMLAGEALSGAGQGSLLGSLVPGSQSKLVSSDPGRIPPSKAGYPKTTPLRPLTPITWTKLR